MKTGIRTRGWRATVMVTLITIAASTPAAGEGQPLLAGAYYFGGWWKGAGSGWHDGSWLKRYPGRQPLLGLYNSPNTMSAEIDAAADHGLDFFSILWYYPEKAEAQGYPAHYLNQPLDDFRASPNASRLKFMITYCNEGEEAGLDFAAVTNEEWERAIQAWVSAMKHPSYLRVVGKAVFNILSVDLFLMREGGDIERCRAKIDRLRAAAEEAGAGPLLVGIGVAPDAGVDADHPAAQLADFTSTYANVPDWRTRKRPYPYSSLDEFSKTVFHLHADDAIPFVPVLMAGFDARPWQDPRAFFRFPSSRQWSGAVRTIATELDANPQIGRLSLEPRVQAFIVYAWNEYGEGGILAPTRGDKYMKLVQLQRALGR